VHHSDRGVQYLSIRYTERLREAGIEPSVGSVGDSYLPDGRQATTRSPRRSSGCTRREVIQERGPWRGVEHVEFETLDWVDCFSTKRLLEPIGHISPAEFEAPHYHPEGGSGPRGRTQPVKLPEKPGRFSSGCGNE